jgi:hypothetical protein
MGKGGRREIPGAARAADACVTAAVTFYTQSAPAHTSHVAARRAAADNARQRTHSKRLGL